MLGWLLASCATVVMPDGGPKDTTPPKPLNFEPQFGAVNFSSNKIVITFDEIIQLKDLNSNLVVSPQMKKNPEVLAQGKKLVIKLPDSLEANTTYSIFLGSSIINYTENLPLPKLQYVFSTGSLMDSLMFRGKVVNAFDLQGVEGAIVMLYKTDEDSIPMKSKPFYLTKTLANGDFELTNLSGGQYKVFALKDMNSNYIYDQPTEEIAFLDSLITPQINPDSLKLDSLTPKPILPEIRLKMFREIERKQTILSSKVINPNLVKIAFRLPADSMTVDVLKGKITGDEIYKVTTRNLDTVNLWLPSKAGDSLKIGVSAAGGFRDTLELVLNKKNKKNQADSLASKPAPLRYKNYANQMVPYFADLAIDFERPINKVDKSKISLLKLTDDRVDTIAFSTALADSVSADRLLIKAKLDEDSKYSLTILDSCVTSIFNETHDTIKSTFVTTKSRNYGNLKFVVDDSLKQKIIVHLIDAKGQTIREVFVKDSVAIFSNLEPTEYKLKVIFDANGNDKWDTGDYLKGIFPEKVVYFEKAINVRANWDIEERWIL